MMFELYNEPHDVSWSVWKSGGATGEGLQAVGMQQLYDTVRATGAQNLVIIGGLDWAYDLSGVPANRIDGYNIVYATHPYTQRRASAAVRLGHVLGIPDRDRSGHRHGVRRLDETTLRDGLQRSSSRTPTRTPPAGPPGPGSRRLHVPALIDDWSATPSPTGDVVKAALLGYDDPPASPPRPLGPDVIFTFDHGLQGWEFNLFDDGNILNLAVHPPAGGIVPTLTVNAADGNPDPGSLRVRVGFTAFDQYVDPGVNFFDPRQNLTGKVLHARIKLVSGSFAQGAFQFHASTGDSFVYGSSFFTGDTLPLGVWVPVDLDLGGVTSPGFDPSQVIQIGVQFLSGFSSGGGTFVDTGETVFEIDTVTD